MSEAIVDFRGPNRWLSNFHLAPVEYEGILYPSTEHAYQAAKSSDPEVRKQFLTITCVEAKNLGNKIKHDPVWTDEKRLQVMYDLIKQKFTRHEDLKAKLLATGDAELVEGNYWKDVFWGQCPIGTGLNNLGKILMKVREEVK